MLEKFYCGCVHTKPRGAETKMMSMNMKMYYTASSIVSSRAAIFSHYISRSYGTRQESRQWKQKPNRKPRLTLILTESIPTLGSKGEMVHVKRGYGRNYLLPKNKAVYASQDNMKLYNTVEKRLFIPKRGTSKVKISQRDTSSVEYLAYFLKDKTITIEQDETDDKWCIYEYQVAAALRKQWQCHAPLDCMDIPTPINSFGTSNVTLMIDEDTQVSIRVDVVPSTNKLKPDQEELSEKRVINAI